MQRYDFTHGVSQTLTTRPFSFQEIRRNRSEAQELVCEAGEIVTTLAQVVHKEAEWNGFDEKFKQACEKFYE